jgi:hypothetical protein
MSLSPLRRTDPDFFKFNWPNVLAATWEQGCAYSIANVVRPDVAMGFYAECMTSGLSASREPRWRAEAGAVVRDGSVLWVMRDPSSVSLPTITAATYTITPAGITQSGAAISGSVTTVKLDASAASLGTYNVVAEITAGGEDYSIETDLEVIA